MNKDGIDSLYETGFITDVEKMRDFKKLTKEEFLRSYSYLTEEEYRETKRYLDFLQKEGDAK